MRGKSSETVSDVSQSALKLANIAENDFICSSSCLQHSLSIYKVSSLRYFIKETELRYCLSHQRHIFNSLF